jgi:hypothetical protein
MKIQIKSKRLGNNKSLNKYKNIKTIQIKIKLKIIKHCIIK